LTVRAKLDGHVFALATLAWHFPTGDPWIVNDDRRTYLQATASTTCDLEVGLT
jgi:hypothetical protein